HAIDGTGIKTSIFEHVLQVPHCCTTVSTFERLACPSERLCHLRHLLSLHGGYKILPPWQQVSRAVFPRPVPMWNHTADWDAVVFYELFHQPDGVFDGLFKIPVTVYANLNCNGLSVPWSVPAISGVIAHFIRRQMLDNLCVVNGKM